jgi:hypothetical protein
MTVRGPQIIYVLAAALAFILNVILVMWHTAKAAKNLGIVPPRLM